MRSMSLKVGLAPFFLQQIIFEGYIIHNQFILNDLKFALL